MKYLGFDIGGTKCAVSIGEIDDNGLNILQKEKIRTDFSVPPAEIIDRLMDMAETMTGLSQQAIGSVFPYVGISCGGPLNEKKGIILSPPNLPGWDEVPIVSLIERRWGNHAYITNDANACALAEYEFGAGRGSGNMIFLTFGSGMGSGLIINGELYSGVSGMAGEVGHVRLADDGPVGYGKEGSFEGFCSGNGIARLGKKLAAERLDIGETCSFCNSKEEIDGITAERIANAAREGNNDAKHIFDICGEKLGVGLAMLIDILNPECIVIGSVYARCEDLLRESMMKKLREECLSISLDACRIVPAELSEKVGDYAAIIVASLCRKRKP